MKKTDLAYIAGLFDGEGNICISKERTGWVLRTQLWMTNEYLPNWLRFNFGGYLRRRKGTGENRKACWQWWTCSSGAVEFLRVITPYLILKKPHCQIALCFQDNRRHTNLPLKGQQGFQKLSSEEAALQETQHLSIKALNRTGRPKVTLSGDIKRRGKKIDVAYMAGLFDAEGTITIKDNPWCVIAQLTLTNHSIPYWFKLNFGGSIYHYRPFNKKHSESWRWSVYSQEALNFINSVYPYLILKKPHADVAIRFQAGLRTRGSGGALTEKERAVREAEHIIMQGLNKRGVK